MRIVIDIDDAAYKFVQDTSFVEDESTMFKQTNADRKKTLLLFGILDAIKNGTTLPKGHGDLVDRDAIQKAYDYSDMDYSMVNALNDATTIIGADKVETDAPNFESKEYIEQRLENYNKLLKSGIIISRNLCDSCINNGCIFQSGIVRNHCDFYKAESEEEA